MVLENSLHTAAILIVTAGWAYVDKWMRYNPYINHSDTSLAEPLGKAWIIPVPCISKFVPADFVLQEHCVAAVE
jgi:hypothetical protein